MKNEKLFQINSIKSAGITFITAIGRAGIVFLGAQATLKGFGLSAFAARWCAFVPISGILISYGSIFYHYIHKTYSSELMSKQEEQSDGQHGYGALLYCFKQASIAASLITALVEGIATCVGWHTWLCTLGVENLVAIIIAALIGAISMLGWKNLLYIPTQDAFAAIIESNQRQTHFGQCETGPLYLGLLFAVLSALGGGSIGFFALVHFANSVHISSNLSDIIAAALTPFVAFGVGSIYALYVPLSFQGILQFYRTCHFNDLTWKMLPGLCCVLFTWFATYLLGVTSFYKLLQAAFPAHHVINGYITQGIAFVLGVSAAAVSGRAGLDFLNNPSDFFSKIKSYYVAKDASEPLMQEQGTSHPSPRSPSVNPSKV